MKKQNLRMSRILQGLSQAELGRRIGRSMAWVSLVERGYLCPTPEMVIAIKKAFESYSQSQDGAEYMSLSEVDALIARCSDTKHVNGSTIND